MQRQPKVIKILTSHRNQRHNVSIPSKLATQHPTMMKYFLICTVVILTTSISAADIGRHHVRRLATHDEEESQKEQFRLFALHQLQQFDAAYMQLQKEQPLVDNSECVPCIGSANGNYEHSEHGRMLRLFPKLMAGVKSVIKNITTAATTTNEVDVVPEEPSPNNFMALFFESDTGRQMSGGNTTLAGIFETLLASPLLLLGGIGLALVVILPLAILEATSISTGIPILCILGFASSLLFGACRRRDLSENEVLRQLVDLSFFTKYFPNGQVREVGEDTDVNGDLRQLLRIGLSPGVIDYLNEVTVSSFITDIATHNETRPLVGAALVAITPVLMLEQISEVTNTPIKCIVADCNNRQLQTTASSSMEQHDAQCEIDYFRCQMKKTLMILN